MPTKTDPATVPPLTERDVASIMRQTFDQENRILYSNLSDGKVLSDYKHLANIIRLAYALAASRVDTAEVERRAARKALAECAAWLGKGESQPVRFDEDGRFLLAFERVNAFSDRYLAREHPAPAPRECVKVGEKPRDGDWYCECVEGCIQRRRDNKCDSCGCVNPAVVGQ